MYGQHNPDPREIGRLRDALRAQEIADALDKPVSAVTAFDIFDYDPADRVPGAKCSTWLREYRPVVVRAVSVGGAYPLLAYPDPRDGKGGTA
jgi:hypothetical protein